MRLARLHLNFALIHYVQIQFTTGLAYPTPTEMYITGGRPPIIPDAFVEAYAAARGADPIYGIDFNEVNPMQCCRNSELTLIGSHT